MANQHTPGPWQLSTVPFELRSTDSAAAIYGPLSKEGGACLIADISRSSGDDEATANAHLIAAAPLMLQEMKRYLPILEDLEKQFPETWDFLTQQTGIATVNGFINAIKTAENEK